MIHSIDCLVLQLLLRTQSEQEQEQVSGNNSVIQFCRQRKMNSVLLLSSENGVHVYNL